MTTVRSGAATDVGLVRSKNQDLALEHDPLWAVADGMGGHVGGEVASRTAVEALAAGFDADRSASGLTEAVRRANVAVWEQARDEPELSGMGTTVCATALVNERGQPRLAVVNVGDSRAYLHHRGQLTQITEDHSLAEEMVRHGEITAEEASVHPSRHVLTRALGVEASVEVDSYQLVPVPGDRLLLCSDGLVNEVDDGEIAAVLDSYPDAGAAAEALVRLARAHGGNDNITVVVLDISGDGRAPAGAGDRTGAGRSPLGGSGVEPPHGPVRPEAQAAAPREPVPPEAQAAARPPILTARLVLFLVVLAAIVAGAIWAVGYFATRSYYVGLRGDRLAIYQGRPGGFLWFQPSLTRVTGVTTGQVLASRLGDLQRGMEEPSLGAADHYVSNLVQEARSLGQPPPTTPGTQSVAPPTTATPGTAAASPALGNPATPPTAAP